MTKGECAREARIRAGVTIKELSAHTGIAKNTISRFENGDVDIRISNLEILADALGLSIDEYIGHYWRGKKKDRK